MSKNTFAKSESPKPLILNFHHPISTVWFYYFLVNNCKYCCFSKMSSGFIGSQSDAVSFSTPVTSPTPSKKLNLKRGKFLRKTPSVNSSTSSSPPNVVKLTGGNLQPVPKHTFKSFTSKQSCNLIDGISQNQSVSSPSPSGSQNGQSSKVFR